MNALNKQMKIKILLTYDEIKIIINDEKLTSAEKLNHVVKFAKNNEELKNFTLTQLRNFIYRNIKTKKITVSTRYLIKMKLKKY